MKALFNNRGASVVEILIAMAIGSMLAVAIFITLRQIDEGWLLIAWQHEAVVALIAALKRDQIADYSSQTRSTEFYLHNNQLSDAAGCVSVACLLIRVEVLSDASCGLNRLWSATFQLRRGSPTHSLAIPSLVLDTASLVDFGGDCVWLYQTYDEIVLPHRQDGSLQLTQSQGLDVYDSLLVVVGSSSPQFRVYRDTSNGSGNYLLTTSTTGDGRRINTVDVSRHLPSGRLFAYVTFHDRVNQFGVFELVPEGEPVLRAVRTLGGVLPTGSFPQGWQVLVYGEHVYVITRETAGTELHVFSIADPLQPIEIIGARTELSRTVNDATAFSVGAGALRRDYLIMAASANQKELAIFDVTDTVPKEIVALDLPGDSNAEALYVSATQVYLGRQSVSAGPELYQFSKQALLAGDVTPQGTHEVGSGVGTISQLGGVLYVSTSRSPSELDRYSTDVSTWSAGTARLSRTVVPGVLPYLTDRTANGVVLISRLAGEERIISLQTP